MVRLNQVRGEFEGHDIPRESRDNVAGLAVGMVDYCLFEAQAPDDDDECTALGEASWDSRH
jgi:hypothetical protein